MSNPFHLSERPEKRVLVERRIGEVFPVLPQIAFCTIEHKMVFPFVFVGNQELDEVFMGFLAKSCEDALLFDELGLLLGV